ncbi:esterase [soil metagenome]
MPHTPTMNAPPIDPAFELLPAQGPVELVFMFFHGVGGRADGMLPFARRMQAEYPQAAVVGINAPDAYDGGTGGFQWFSVQGITEESRPARVAAPMPTFIATVRAAQQRFGVTWERTALFGFSQGAIMSLEAVQAEPELAGRVLAFSGRYATAPMYAPVDTTLHFCHGMKDAVIAYVLQADAAERLVALGADVTADILPGIGHELHPQLIDKAVEQLRTFIPKRVWRQALAEAPVLPRAASSRELGEDCE